MANEMAAFESVEQTMATYQDFPLFKLHSELSYKELSSKLLDLSIKARTYDDQLKCSEIAGDYREHARNNDDGHYVGILDQKEEFYAREACNKIIHAQEVRPIYERIDKYADTSQEMQENDIWYLTGEIELKGKNGGKEWNAVLHTQPFLETLLSLVEFGLPD